jgi:hypothetical protein
MTISAPRADQPVHSPLCERNSSHGSRIGKTTRHTESWIIQPAYPDGSLCDGRLRQDPTYRHRKSTLQRGLSQLLHHLPKLNRPAPRAEYSHFARESLIGTRLSGTGSTGHSGERAHLGSFELRFPYPGLYGRRLPKHSPRPDRVAAVNRNRVSNSSCTGTGPYTHMSGDLVPVIRFDNCNDSSGPFRNTSVVDGGLSEPAEDAFHVAFLPLDSVRSGKWYERAGKG